MKWIYNNTQEEKVYNGQSYPSEAYTQIPNALIPKAGDNELILADILSLDISISEDGNNKISDPVEGINYLKGNKILQDTRSEAISSNVLHGEGKILYAKVHGMKADIAAGQTHIFSFSVPYTEVFFQGSEVLVDIIGVTDYDVFHPELGVIEQYAYALNIGTIKYTRESKYAARIPQGICLRCSYTNDTDGQLEVGVNFVMHEIREE